MSKLFWCLKQLLPLTYVSNFGDKDGQKICVWRMWLGRCFAIREWAVTKQVHPERTLAEEQFTSLCAS